MPKTEVGFGFVVVGYILDEIYFLKGNLHI